MQATTRPLTRRSGLSRVLYEARREWTAYLFLSPGLILFAVFTVFSVGFSFYLSFHQWNILEPQKPFVGLQNYRELLHDRYFLGAIVNTLYFAAVSVPVTMAIGLLVALMLNTQIRFRGLFRTLYYLPGVTSLVVAAIIWKWVFSGDYGLLNYYLLKLHIIDKPILWLSDRNLAMPAVITVSVWQGVGFHMVVYLAALQSIPQEIYDAAKVDGASAFRRLIYITVPLLRPTMFFQFRSCHDWLTAGIWTNPVNDRWRTDKKDYYSGFLPIPESISRFRNGVCCSDSLLSVCHDDSVHDYLLASCLP